ncbi:hypothetical protein DY000_02007686 [Brassica cretica]|uniref:Retrotransposon gag domain-containing protein n=1 Tax=Brassica cretica TaxID=69181 RepID=A0ABQ7CHT4_BRACR|nr:hypothetical protein DY000_02007686 [Brassica cretica]
MFSDRLDAMQSMVERLPGVAPPIRKSNPDSYADTPFTEEITLIEMPIKFSFPSIKAYDDTTDPDDHVAQYRQRMLAVALPKESIASFAVLSDKFVEQFASSMDLEKTSDSLYEILQHQAKPMRGYIARFNEQKVAIPECSIPTAISAFKRGFLLNGDIYNELTKYQCKTTEDVLSRAWAHVKWEEAIASHAKVQPKQDPKMIRPDRTERDEKPSQRSARDSRNRNRGRYQNRPIEKAEGMAVSTWPDISHLSVSRPELINVLRQMGQQERAPKGVPFRESQEPPKQGENGCEEKHLERQARPRGGQAQTPAPRNIRDKLHGQGAGESPHSTSRRPVYLAHCSELPEPANREGGRDGSVHVAKHLLPLRLKAGADQCSEADGPTGQVASEDESSRLFPKPWLLAKSHLSKETIGKPTKAAPVSPPRQDRMIHVISGGSESCGIIHAAAKRSTWNAKHGLEAAKPKCLLLGTDETSFTTKEQEKVLTPHHDALVILLTVANCLGKPLARHTEEPEVEETDDVPLTEGDQTDIPRSVPS